MAKNKYEVVIDERHGQETFVRGDVHYVTDGNLEIRDEIGVVLYVPEGRWSCLKRTGIEKTVVDVTKCPSPILVTKFVNKYFGLRDTKTVLEGTQYTITTASCTFYVEACENADTLLQAVEAAVIKLGFTKATIK